MENKKQTSLYDFIASAVVDGQLPKDFSLPQKANKNEIRWMDGAMDGVYIYHMGFSELADDNKALMIEAVLAASKKDFGKADILFCKLGEKVRAIAAIDELQAYIIDHKEELSAENIYGYAVHAVLGSVDRECVKYGLSLLELFNTDNEEKIKDIVRTIGLSDEFSLFAVYVMLQWEDGNNEVYQLAKKIYGWGRIHAIERIEPTTEEIQEWLLKEGVHNTILPSYSALTCWQKSDAENRLKNPSKEEMAGIRDIIAGLLEEGPVSGISGIENHNDIIMVFLNQMEKLELTLEDYEVIRGIRIYFENQDADTDNIGIVSLCNKLLDTDICRDVVLEAVKEGRAIGLAQDLKLDYKEDILGLLKTSFEEKFYLCSFIMADYKDAVLKIFRENLPLEEMKTLPTNSLGLGKEYQKQHCLENILQELKIYPLEGQEFVETALQSAPIRTRNIGIAVLESWVNMKQIPLKELMPEIYKLLCRLRDIETDEKVVNKMDRLIAGNIIFEDKK